MPPGSKNDIARKIVDDGVAPRVAVGFAARKDGYFRYVTGGAEDTTFDLASLTKPVLALAFATRPELLVQTAGAVAAEARGTFVSETAIELLLAHRAGLQPHVQLYEAESFDVSRAIREAADASRPGGGEEPVYSDMGYVVAGHALAIAMRAVDAGEAMTEQVLHPLGLEATMGVSRDLGLSSRLESVAPTEDVPWRGGVVHGQVHDENAWALTGTGGSGHAGLFGTVASVLRFGTAMLDLLHGHRSPLGSVDVSWMVRERPGGTLRAGFDGKSISGSSAGLVLGPKAFGHLGFTGTSIWIDPEKEVVVTLLTNRVHPTRQNTRIREARPWAHDALARLALSL